MTTSRSRHEYMRRVVEADLVARDAEPEEVAMHALELAYEDPEVFGPQRDLEAGDLLHALDEGARVGVGADAAYPLDEVDVLHVRRFSAAFSMPRWLLSQPHRDVGDALAVQGDQEALGSLRAGCCGR